MNKVIEQTKKVMEIQPKIQKVYNEVLIEIVRLKAP